jgi:predicted dehydrogenase
MKLGLIGLGRWGSNYLDNLLRIRSVESINVAGRGHQYRNRSESNVSYTEDWKEVCNDSRISGLIIAVSPGSQYEITKYALQNRIPVLVEKPFTLSKEHTDELINLSKDNNVLCMVGYTHIFSSGYQDLKRSVLQCGDIRKLFSEGLSHGPFRNNVPILWDWGCHDIAMCIDLLNQKPQSATVKLIFKHPMNLSSEVLELNLDFGSNLLARCIVGNASEFKRRDFCVICDNGTFIYDGLSGGLSKQYTNAVFSNDSNRFKMQITPLECVLNEFINSLDSKKKYHYTLDLAKEVNDTLANIKLI